MATRTQSRPVRRGLVIGGAEGPAESGRTTPDVNPVTGKTYAEVPAADASDVARAVGAAHDAFPSWAATPPSTRSILERAGDLLGERAAAFAEIMLQETSGTPMWANFNIRMSSDLIRQAATRGQRRVLTEARRGATRRRLLCTACAGAERA